MLIDVIAGARPNFMKVAALFTATSSYPELNLRLVHTGQHYDYNMSEVFFEELELPFPAHHLEVGSGSHTWQTAEIMKRYEVWTQENPAEMCVVVGDVNSTVACALVAVKRGMKIAHVEAGLRSLDRTMPEEINRIITDSISDLLFATEPAAVINLAREGHSSSAIHLVGQVMVDTLFRMKPKADALSYYEKFAVAKQSYAYLTLHRPSNVDYPDVLAQIVEQMAWLGAQIPIIFAIHPRTQSRLESFGLNKKIETILKLTLPLSYLESLSILSNARMVITDSGGLQEESSALGIPCLTLRDNTERPITIQEGTNTLIGHDWDLFRDCVKTILSGQYRRPTNPIPYWDGRAGQRILQIIESQG